MAFLDNSGDIILDAVLTDTGRLRLAQGDGSFKISKFALGDDEINYGLYNKNHASGSAYYDLEVLQTPVLEAFTNNTSNLKSKLLSMSRTNVMYMPTLKLAKVPLGNATYKTGGSNGQKYQTGPSQMFRRNDPAGSFVSDEKFYVAVDKFTYDAMVHYRSSSSVAGVGTNGGAFSRTGIIKGFTSSTDPGDTDIIRVDQGLDTTEISPALGLDTDLYESAYIVEMDYRLGRLKRHNSDTTENVNYIDDDNIASYYVTSQGTAQAFINPYGALDTAQDSDGSKSATDLEDIWLQTFEGPRGSTLHFRIQASQELNSSTYLFEQLGSSELSDAASNIMGFPTSDADSYIKSATTYYIDATIRVVGANTGFRLDIPVRYVKIKA